jgi:hypothetical protein
VLICLTGKATTKTGFIQKEIKYALDVAAEQPEGEIFLIPVKFEECAVPENLSQWHWVDLFAENGFERLVRALTVRAESRQKLHPVSPSSF